MEEEERVEEERARIRTGNPCHMDELSNSRCERGGEAKCNLSGASQS